MSKRREQFLFAFSRHAAWMGGIQVPLLETIRRWGTGNYLLWLDDYLLGGALLFAAWRAHREGIRARPWLAAAWGFACGIGLSSFGSHWLRMDEADVSGFDPRLLTAAIGAGLLVALFALFGSLKRGRRE